MDTLFFNKWHATHFESQGQRQPLEQGEDGSFMWFKEDGTFIRNENGEVAALLWQYDKATQTISIPNAGNTETYTLKSLAEGELILQSFSKDFGEVDLVLKRID